MFQELKKKNEELIDKYTKNGDEAKLHIQRLIESLLDNDNCFFVINMEDAYNILNDLGYSEEESSVIYRDLIGGTSFKYLMKNVTSDNKVS